MLIQLEGTMGLANLSVRARLTILLAFVNVLLLVAAGYAYYALTRQSAQLEAVINTQNRVEAAGDLARRAQIDFKVQVQEWKDLLIRGGDTELFNKHLKGFNERSAAVRDDLSKLAPMLDKLGLQATLANDLVTEQAELDRRYMEALKLYDGSKPTSTLEVDKAVRGMDRAPTEHFADIVKKIQQQGDLLDDAAMSAADKTKTALLAGLLALAVVTIVVSTAWGTMTISTIVRRLRRATEVARTVAAGDLTTQIDVGRPDELGQLLASLRDMNGSLAGIVDRVRESAEKVTVASSQIAAGNMDLSSRTEEQASNLEETAASIEEMTATVGQNAQHAAQANELAAAAKEVARKGGHVVGEVVKTMEGIQASSHKISDIISVIDSIAFQTNILALNAAVEAARAGEQGRGFAVVAAEVRSLAQRSANAAREIKGLITESVQRVDDGSKLAGGAGTTMNEIVSSVNRVSQLISEIAGATAEQSSGIAQANAAVSQLDKVTQQNAALVEESTAASESLRSLAVEMSEAVAVFQLASHKAAPALPASPAQMAIKSYQARALANSSGGPRLANKAAAANTRLEEEWKEF
ncbi:MAG: methyl-accepting chemotaxis protein [Usitatibacter sp.]